jgi:hypothetical protein
MRFCLPSIAAAQAGEPGALAVRHREITIVGKGKAPGFLGDLGEIELHAAVLVVVRALQLLEERLGGGPVLHLHGERRDRELVVAVAVVRGPEPLEDRTRLGVALLLDVELRERAGGRLRVRLIVQEGPEICDGFGGRALAEDLGLQHHRAFPARLECQRAVHGLDGDRRRRDVGETRVEGGERDGELRLGQRRIRLGDRLDQLERGGPVGLVRKQSVQLEKCFAERRAGFCSIGQHALEFRLEIVAGAGKLEGLARGAARQRGNQLSRTIRHRIELAPQPRGLERERASARGDADLGGTARQRRVAGLAAASR